MVTEIDVLLSCVSISEERDAATPSRGTLAFSHAASGEHNTVKMTINTTGTIVVLSLRREGVDVDRTLYSSPNLRRTTS